MNFFTRVIIGLFAFQLATCSSGLSGLNDDSFFSQLNDHLLTESTGAKSILKRSENMTEKTKSKTVTFYEEQIIVPTSGERKEESHIHKTLKEILIETYETAKFGPLIYGMIHDYEEENGYYWKNFDIPVELEGLIKSLLPSLEAVKISKYDLASLFIFSAYHYDTPFTTDSSTFCRFFNYFMMAFPNCHSLIKLLKSQMNKKVRCKVRVFEKLIEVAFKNGFNYTIEAFFAAIGQEFLEIIIKNSIKYRNMKIFERFVSLEHSLTDEIMTFWSLKYDNFPAFTELTKRNISIDRLCSTADQPIILFLAKSKNHYAGMVSLLEPFEGLMHFSEALSITRNFEMVKELIKYENFYFEQDNRPEILNRMRSLIIEGNFPTSFADQTDAVQYIKWLLKFDSEDQLIIEAFHNTIPEIIDSVVKTEVFIEVIFHKCKTYLKLLLGHPGQKYPFTVGLVHQGYQGYYGPWELVRGSNTYLSFMRTLIQIPGFDILHAIGNPDFPKCLWPEIIEKFKYQNGPVIITNALYRSLYYKYGFTNDSDLQCLSLESTKCWTLLNLAILNFNLTAVDELLKHFSYHFNISASNELVRNYISILDESCDDILPRLKGRMALYRFAHGQYPRLFETTPFPTESQLKTKILSNLQEIKELLDRVLGI